MLAYQLVRNHFADPDCEGEVPWLYLDNKQLMTVGIGCQIFSREEAQTLPFVYRESHVENGKLKQEGQAADKVEIGKDYDNVIRGDGNEGSDSFKSVTKLNLPKEEIDSLFFARYFPFQVSLWKTFPDYDSFPNDVQLALLDMIFTLGSLKDYKNMKIYIKNRNWSAAAFESYRNGVGEKRNMQTAKLFFDAQGDHDELVAAFKTFRTKNLESAVSAEYRLYKLAKRFQAKR